MIYNKKLASIFLLISFIFSFTLQNGFCAAQKPVKPKSNTVLKATIKKEVRRNNPPNTYSEHYIEDELAKEIDRTTVKKIKYKKLEIIDEGVAVLPENTQKKEYKEEIVKDEKIVATESNKKLTPSDYKKTVITDNGAEVVLKPLKRVSTKSKKIKIKKDSNNEQYSVPFPSIGDRVAFKVVKDVIKDGEIVIEKGTLVYAQVGEVAPRAMGGAPAEMTLENFEMIDKNGKHISLDGQIASSGYSLSFWIGLAELATTPFLIGFAVPLLRVLPGGQAVITPRKNYIVYY